MEQFVNLTELDKRYGRTPTQTGGSICVRGVNSLAKLPEHGGAFSEDAARQVGFRLPSAMALETSFRSGARVAPVGSDSVVSAPGASRVGTEKLAGPDVAATESPPVMENTAALRHMLKWQFGACPEEWGPLCRLVKGATRYAKSYALAYGFARGAPCAARRRPHANLYAEDSPKSSPDPARQVYLAFSASFRAGPHRLPQGNVDWSDLPGAF